MGEKRNVYGVLVGKPHDKKPLGRPRYRREDNIKMDRIEGVDWIELAQDRDWWQSCGRGGEPFGSIKCGRNS